MQEELVTFETAKLAKDKGFIVQNQIHFFSKTGEEITNYYVKIYNKKSVLIVRPTQALLQKWLRDIHNFHVEVNHSFADRIKNKDYNFKIHNTKEQLKESGRGYLSYNSLEEALEMGLQEALKLVNI